jgi:hypothetical protein
VSGDPTLEMADYSASQERALKQFISSHRCSFCRRAFGRENVRVAARQDQLWIVSVRCGLCRNQQVFWIALKPNGEETLLHDLSKAEEEHFAAMSAVTSDEVLDMHEFLQEFDGDFKELFED